MTDRRLVRVRIALVGVMGAVLAVGAGRIFDEIRWWLPVSPVLVALAAAGTAPRRWFVRLGTVVLALVGGVAMVVVANGGGTGDVVAAFTAGPQRLLSTDWPSPTRPDLLGTVAAGIGLLVGVAAELSSRPRLHLTPLTPIAVAATLVIAASAPSGPWADWPIVVGALAAAFAALAPGVGLRERLTLLRGERVLLPALGLTVGASIAVAVPLSFDERADPRRNDPADLSATLLDPLEATLALQALDPPVDLYSIDVAVADADAATPTRWRTAALSAYDGRRWLPELTLRPIGRRLADDVEVVVESAVTFLDDDLQLVPLAGPAVTIDAEIETDPARTLVRLADRPDPSDSIAVTSGIDPAPATVTPGSIRSRPIDDTVSGLSDLAETIVEEASETAPTLTILDQLRAVESSLRDGFVLDPDAPGGGVQRVLIDRFLRDTQRGNAEQFATAFVLLARSLGVEARLATGFVVDPERAAGDAVLLTSADAAVWPEVATTVGWLAFDPVPAEEQSDVAPEEPEPQVQSPAAPQPPVAPPPESSEDPVVSDPDEADSDLTTLPGAVRLLIRIAAWTGALLVPVVLAVGTILVVKWRRRRRRLRGAPAERIRGAWWVATSRLVDAGMAIRPSQTNDEIAHRGTEFAPTAGRELTRLATHASAATFGDPVRPDLLAEDAAGCLGQIETSLAGSRTAWERLRWRLSLRSLRRRTRSPV